MAAMTMKSIATTADDIRTYLDEAYMSPMGKEVTSKLWDPFAPEATVWYRSTMEAFLSKVEKHLYFPAATMIFSPLAVGILMGKYTLCGFLVGAILSGVQIGLSSINASGVWANVKKAVETLPLLTPRDPQADGGEQSRLAAAAQRMLSDAELANLEIEIPPTLYDGTLHASKVGSTIGEPLKHTAIPGINTAMKVMPIVALVFSQLINR